RRIPTLLAEVKDLLENSKARREESWRHLVGEDADQFLGSRDQTIKGLTNRSAAIRSVAFQILLKRWKLDVDVLPQCAAAMRGDPDPEVRFRAVCCLSGFFQGSADAEASAMLAQVVSQADTPTRVREAAYLALLRVHSLQLPRQLLRSINHPDPV